MLAAASSAGTRLRAALLMLAAAVLAACASSGWSVPAPEENPVEQALRLEGVSPAKSALVIYRLEDEKIWASGGARIRERFTPASTSKIPHTLLAYEAGAVTGPDEPFEWDGQKRFADSWNEDQTFGDAFQRSTVWIYQIVVPRIGAARLTEGLQGFGYGNAEIGGPESITRYWLEGPLAISATEQVEFLSRLARRTLPLSARSYDLAVPVMVLEEGEGWTLYGKTGWKSVEGQMDIGWFVGWVEQSGGPAPGTYVFALNMDMPGGMEEAPRRRAAVERALREIGALPPSP
ncbi:OXA-1090 family carbapenem-hydrolyzing class D beta-lactamase [Hyphomonas sp.]|uniref:OXA-1090 family carbapenem-hydrolyzing class D beta-lactamase n=1 Tax=Hyphomonas sp. TaxID=87 RepID=UPI0025BCBD60|nr:OXA-1090 family carbapenem-hydrolyzing class D beta-lactamase [Hyphomonas sp.]